MSNIIDKILVSGVTYDLPSGGSGSTTVELTQAQYDALVSGGTVDPDTYYIITDATPQDMSQYWTSAQTNSAITQAVNGKQDTLVSGTNIKTINNESLLGSGNIEIEGGGKAVSGGTNISITTGETVDTINCTLPIFAKADRYDGNLTNIAVGDSSNISSGSCYTYAEGYQTKATGAHGAHAEGYNTLASGQYGAHAEGWKTTAQGSRSHAEGENTRAVGNSSHAEGYNTLTNGYGSHAEGYNTKTDNSYEHASGQYNVSNKINTTFGDSGNTLFSVGNGTADDARHNAFEIRQNGDIYITKDGQDVKLQDQLGGGGSITVDDMLSSTSTNHVQNKVVKSATDRICKIWGYGTSGQTDIFSWATGSTSQYIDGYISFAKINNTRIVGKNDSPVSNFSLVETSAITTNITSSSTDSEVPSAKAVYDALQEGGGGGGGMTEDDELLLSTALTDLNDRKIDASEVKSNYQKKGDYVTTNTLNTRLAEYETALDEQNVEEVTAYALNDLNERFGGLKIVKITETEYAALTTKDENTLYIVVADPS